MTNRENIVDSYRSRIEAGSGRKLLRHELQFLVDDFVAQLKELEFEEEIKQRCKAEIALLEEGYPQATIQGNQMPLYRNAITKALERGALPLTPQNSHSVQVSKNSGEEFTVQNHYALTYFKYDNAVYQRVRNQGTEANNKRQDDLQPINPDRYLEAVQALFEKNDALSLAIVITALTGRRFTEVVVKGTFEPMEHPYMLRFKGQQKKGKDSPAYEILTLIPADRVFPVIQRFRSLRSVQALAGKAYDSPEMNKFNTRLNQAVQRVFGDTGIIPTIEGRKNVSLHRLRGVYGAILIHQWCPNNVNQHRFLQRYLGHVLEGEVTPNSPATPHYFHYFIVDDNGNPKTAQGIKVMANGMVPIEDQVEVQPVLKKRGSLRIAGKEHDRWHEVLEKVAGQEHTQEAKMSRVLELVESHLEGHSSSATTTQSPASDAPAQAAPTESLQVISNQAATLAWLTARIQELEQQVQALQTERDTVAASLGEAQIQLLGLRALQEDNVQLKARLEIAEATINQFRSLAINGGSQSAQSPVPVPAPTTTTERRDVTPEVTQKLEPLAAAPKVVRATPHKERKAFNRAKAVFESLQQWNTSHPQDTFALTAAVLEQGFGINRKAAKEFMDEWGEQVAAHHAAISVENDRTHNRGKNLDALKAFVDISRVSATTIP